MATVKEAKVEVNPLEAAKAELATLEAQLHEAAKAFNAKQVEVDALIRAAESPEHQVNALQAYLATRQNPGE